MWVFTSLIIMVTTNGFHPKPLWEYQLVLIVIPSRWCHTLVQHTFSNHKTTLLPQQLLHFLRRLRTYLYHVNHLILDPLTDLTYMHDIPLSQHPIPIIHMAWWRIEQHRLQDLVTTCIHFHQGLGAFDCSFDNSPHCVQLDDLVPWNSGQRTCFHIVGCNFRPAALSFSRTTHNFLMCSFGVGTKMTMSPE